MDELAKALIQYNISISSVESFTVGNFAAMLGSIPGISKVYRGSLVTVFNFPKLLAATTTCLLAADILIASTIVSRDIIIIGIIILIVPSPAGILWDIVFILMILY